MAFILSAVMVAHATILAVVAFFVLFAASKAAGWIKTFGSALGIWVLLVAVLALACAVATPFVGGFMHGRGPGPGMMQGPGIMQGPGMMRDGPRHMRGWRAPDCPPASNQPAGPATPAPQGQAQPSTQ